PEGADEHAVEKLVWAQLRTCFDPEIPINVVDLGLVYEVVVEPAGDGQRKVSVKMTLTAPGCGMGEILVDDARSRIEMIPTVAEADVELVFDPPWNASMMSEAARLETGMFWSPACARRGTPWRCGRPAARDGCARSARVRAWSAFTVLRASSNGRADCSSITSAASGRRSMSSAWATSSRPWPRSI